MKPSVLDEFAQEFDGLDENDKENKEKGQENRGANEKQFENFCGPTDKLILEDESGRMTLCDLDESVVNSLVTGVVLAVQGTLNNDGEFSVDKENGICFPATPLQPQRELKSPSSSKFVLLVSGLEVGSSTGNPMRFQLLTDYLTGHIGLGSIKHQNLQKVYICIYSCILLLLFYSCKQYLFTFYQFDVHICMLRISFELSLQAIA
uniref:DNA polymerase delta subunit OB-fold domain-containing protein n=1 Tax=Aplanochytrium stocchinoi TaxID=215587 RepID=A0A7S3LN41_9STRA